MYGFNKRNVAQWLNDFAVSDGAYQGVQQPRATTPTTCKMVRVQFSSGIGEQNGFSDLKMCHGRYKGEDRYAAWTDNGFTGQFAFDYCDAYPIDMQLYDKTTDMESLTDFTTTSVISFDPGEQLTEFSQSGGSPDYAADPDLQKRNKIRVFNMSLCPIFNGQWIMVHQYHGRWVYHGSHMFFARLQQDDQSELASESHGRFFIEGWLRDESTASTYDLEYAVTDYPVVAETLRAFNPFTNPIEHDTKCMLTDVGGVLCVIGAECS